MFVAHEQKGSVAGMAITPRSSILLLYGAGLRLLECCRLRVKKVDFAMNQIKRRAGSTARSAALSRG
jgi:site-specific recombinase XerC